MKRDEFNILFGRKDKIVRKIYSLFKIFIFAVTCKLGKNIFQLILFICKCNRLQSHKQCCFIEIFISPFRIGGLINTI